MAGLLLVVSGPSGAGKSTVLRAVMQKRKDMFFSVSATTRPPRPGEVDGREYYFVTPDDFRRMQEDGELLEWAAYAGNLYGTPLSPVIERLGRGETVVLDIESIGAVEVKQKYFEAIMIFLAPSTEQETERRLRSRGTDAEEIIQRRLENSRREYRAIDRYQYIVVNDVLDKAIQTLDAIIIAEAARTGRNGALFAEYREMIK